MGEAKTDVFQKMGAWRIATDDTNRTLDFVVGAPGPPAIGDTIAVALYGKRKVTNVDMDNRTVFVSPDPVVEQD